MSWEASMMQRDLNGNTLFLAIRMTLKRSGSMLCSFHARFLHLSSVVDLVKFGVFWHKYTENKERWSPLCVLKLEYSLISSRHNHPPGSRFDFKVICLYTEFKCFINAFKWYPKRVLLPFSSFWKCWYGRMKEHLSKFIRELQNSLI